MNEKLTNEDYTIDCTGDACVGDEVRFERAIFSGSFRKPKFAGTEIVEGKIVSDSYGKEKQQHTFTLLLHDGKRLLIKGRNLYRNGCKRKPWKNEDERLKVLDEKHSRGEDARTMRFYRKEMIFE